MYVSYQSTPDTTETVQSCELLGLGVRQVTFMYFNAYAMGLYLDKDVVRSLKNSSRWKQEFVKEKILKSCPESKFFFSDLLRRGQGITLLLQTARTTDAPHLRNGFVKFLTQRLSIEKSFTKQEQSSVLEALDSLRAQFPSGTFKQGNRILITRLPSGYLQLSFPDSAQKTRFVIENKYLSNWFFEGYLNAKSPISPALLASVAEGLEKLLKDFSV